ncbi:hypothetical protein L1887_36204 [Cichorium endivia]|nr:hypothetical protein L1887_36204 [Cichorium endivia]
MSNRIRLMDGSDSESEDNSEVPLIPKPLDEKVSSKDNSEVSLITKPVDEKVSFKKRKTKDNSKMEKDKKMDTVSEKVSKKRKLNVFDGVNSKKHKHMRNGDNCDTIRKKKEKISTKDGGKDRNGIADGKSSIPTPKRLFVSDVSTKSVTSDSSKAKFAALILKFTNLDSIPAVTELNEIFSKYGSVRESETEVLRKSNCAKVVFEEKSNAETAFSSAGKFS